VLDAVARHRRSRRPISTCLTVTADELAALWGRVLDLAEAFEKGDR
jgi:hypothetical protein